MIIGGENVVLVEFRHGAIHVECYASRSKCVEGLLNNGSLGRSYWGSSEHLAALKLAEDEIKKIKTQINQEDKK